MVLTCGQRRRSFHFVKNSSSGMMKTSEIYLGGEVKILITSGYLKSCCSRPEWIQLFHTTNDSWTGSQLLKVWRMPLKSVYWRLGKDWAIILEYAICRLQPSRLWLTLGVNFQTPMKEFLVWKGLDHTLRELFLVSLLTCLSQRLMAMSCGFWRACLRLIMISEFPAIAKFFRQWWKSWLTRNGQETLTKLWWI